MTFVAYIKDRIITLTLNGLGIFLLSLYLLALRNSQTTVILIAVIWLFIVAVYLFTGYRSRKRYFDEIYDLVERLDQPYLIQEFIKTSWKLEDRLYKEILYRSNKAVIERIEGLEESQKEYREFIEGWIHEVKLPITGMRLAYHNHKEKREDDRKIEAYLTEMDNAVERVLFYARSNQVYKDFAVAETDLRQTVLSVVSRNKYLLIQNGMSVKVECEAVDVMTDRKWLDFILTQILSNAVKYKKESGGEIVFRSEASRDGVCLRIRDAGIGIPKEELGKIFEKGFTGSNGRSREKTTGIGLYLCGKLCRKLEIAISVDSVINEYTEISLCFPKNSYLTKL